jgi:hypothetical protein
LIATLSAFPQGYQWLTIRMYEDSSMAQYLSSSLLIASSAIALIACQPSPQQLISSQWAPSEPTSSQPSRNDTTGFNPELYLLANPDVAKPSQEGRFKSALEHYEKVGQSSKNAERKPLEGFFTGTEKKDSLMLPRARAFY